jgi:hypothetical protein
MLYICKRFGVVWFNFQILSFLLQDLIVMGAPGSSYWTGTVFVYNITTNQYKAFVDRQNQVKFGSYLGTVKIWPTWIICALEMIYAPYWPVTIRYIRNCLN